MEQATARFQKAYIGRPDPSSSSDGSSFLPLRPLALSVEQGEDIRDALEPVSYTHLTLPTICSV
eukprot:12066193-Alexandrium_andersonii.AAC.1